MQAGPLSSGGFFLPFGLTRQSIGNLTQDFGNGGVSSPFLFPRFFLHHTHTLYLIGQYVE